MEFDIIIVGAGPAGLAAAIRLAQLNNQLSICVLEKGAEIGAHSLSGAVLETRALDELIPDWQQKKAPLETMVTGDTFLFLTEKKSFPLPTPRPMKNKGNYIISLGKFCRWLGKQAENLGVHIFPGFAATDIIYEDHRVGGIITGEKGIDKYGQPTEQYQPGMRLTAKQTIFSEGCRGSLTQMLFEKFQLRQACGPQTYALGIKELWEIPAEKHQSGLVMHSVGWPLDNQTYGGSFIYHFEKNKMAIGFVIGLDYPNPYLNPYEEFQRFKTHPAIRPFLENGKRLTYGARALNEGGWQAIPHLSFPGGVIVGCGAGFLNVPKIKGIHTAMKSGMIAAENLLPLSPRECPTYSEKLKKSWVGLELYTARNIRPAMQWGLWKGLAYAAIDTYLFRGHAPWTFSNLADHTQLQLAANSKKITYPKHDHKITFDLMSSVFLSNIQYAENQPCHLLLKNNITPREVNLKLFDSPEQRYCPAGVYEIIYEENNQPKLQINAANCIHCKACDIKDPSQNIKWTAPAGGSGPQYGEM
ncbi:MAG: Electron transfer flavoprotein-ubiquinone oxidoreductase [Gammaproteobacteria bacterium]|nr:Electron transfer flavoprotein-ubiquinone oxidoreductase [Gammaproteobacteria bacterium]